MTPTVGSKGNQKPLTPGDEALLRLLDSGLRSAGDSELGEDRSLNPDKELDFSLCPDAAAYLQLAGDQLEEVEADKLLAHAADCQHCAGQLKRGMEVLDGNPSQQELAAIAELSIARREWQQSMATRLAGTPVRKSPARWQRFGLGAGAVAAGLIMAASLFLWQRRMHEPDHQLALAYVQARTLELRIPQARYAPVTAASHTRGSANHTETAYLLEAQAQLARLLERSPTDPRALQLEARADVLEERYDAAVEVLDRLNAAGPVTSELLVDSALAYYQRGVAGHREVDKSTALDCLRRADKLAPTDPVTLFNEAIVMEDRGEILNAEEVWHRFLLVEGDPGWVAEGKQRLAALEAILNRAKTHDSRLRQMLVTPQAMDSLAGNAQRLSSVDEELTTMQLDQILPIAFPLQYAAAASQGQQARGSPCGSRCQAARRLLNVLSISIERNHNDFWLADLLGPVASGIDSLPAPVAGIYLQALDELSKATREDQTGAPSTGLAEARQSQNLFHQLRAFSSSGPGIRASAEAGEQRAAAEVALALQRTTDYRECRAFVAGLRGQPRALHSDGRYPWIEAAVELTEKVCDDTPETRAAGRVLLADAQQLAEKSHYRILRLRIQGRTADDALNTDDRETAEEVLFSMLGEMLANDMPPFRIVNTLVGLGYVEFDSPGKFMNESVHREIVAWEELTGRSLDAAHARLDLARAEIRVGDMGEAERQIKKAYEERVSKAAGVPGETGPGGARSGGAHSVETGRDIAELSERESNLALALLEAGDAGKAADFLRLAEEHMAIDSDTWTLRRFGALKGMVKLSAGQLAEAADVLEANLRIGEGVNVRAGDRANATEFAQLDHDLYAELAATWLAQGRSAADVLALWERFRLRELGLPITPCPNHGLGCELPRLLEAQHRLRDSVVAGQIVLLDRVLVYRVDQTTIHWDQHFIRRDELIGSAEALEREVSSPYTPLEASMPAGLRLASLLLPSLPKSFGDQGSLYIEPDPRLRNLSWPVLSMGSHALGLLYPIAEMRSLLAESNGETRESQTQSAGKTGQSWGVDRPLVIGASVAGNGQPPLPEALDEASEVGRFFRSPNLLLGEQATAARVAAALGSATSIHFAGHATQTAAGTELLLAQDAHGGLAPWVDGELLRRHPPRACRLAVLSACATGLHEDSWNHPPQDIVETLSSAGVPDVVATHWQIDSIAAVEFMDAFYASLGKGNNTAIALMTARRVQFGNFQYKNPYYWGAYYLTSTREPHIRKVAYASP